MQAKYFPAALELLQAIDAPPNPDTLLSTEYDNKNPAAYIIVAQRCRVLGLIAESQHNAHLAYMNGSAEAALLLADISEQDAEDLKSVYFFLDEAIKRGHYPASICLRIFAAMPQRIFLESPNPSSRKLLQMLSFYLAEWT